MVLCVNCRHPLQHLTRQEQGATIVEHCPHCDCNVDPYLEKEELHSYVDMMLLREDAWTHMLHNRTLVMSRVIFVILLACTLESYVLCIVKNPKCHGPETVHLPQNISVLTSLLYSDAENESMILPSLRLMEALPRCAGWELTHQMFDAFRYAVLESIFTGIGMVWAASLGGSSVESQGHGPRGIKAVGLSSGCMLAIALFLIWDVPLVMLAIIDCARILWVLVALKALSGTSNTFAVVMCVIGYGCRVVFRLVTGWSPVLMLMHIMALGN